jgi:hypothetical protein
MAYWRVFSSNSACDGPYGSHLEADVAQLLTRHRKTHCAQDTRAGRIPTGTKSP